MISGSCRSDLAGCTSLLAGSRRGRGRGPRALSCPILIAAIALATAGAAYGKSALHPYGDWDGHKGDDALLNSADYPNEPREDWSDLHDHEISSFIDSGPSRKIKMNWIKRSKL